MLEQLPQNFVWMVILPFLLIAQANGQPASQPHTQVALIAEEQTVQPGHAVWVGVHFKLKSGWHIYWLNPGDSGEPTTIAWELPEGLTPGEVEWPAPQRISDHSLVDYGYEDQVMLLAPIRAARTLTLGKPAVISADVKWLECRDICIPQRARVELSLPLARGRPQIDARRRAAFERARASIPKPLPRRWRVRVRSETDYFILSVQGTPPVSGAEFFPLVSGQIKNSAPQVFTKQDPGFRLRMRKSDQLRKPIQALKGVLVLDSCGVYQANAPIVETRRKNTPNS